MNKKDRELLELLAEIQNISLMSDVLSNLLTPQEREELALRLQIIKGLESGKKQRQLAAELKVSLATVSRGSRELKYGKPGLKNILKND